MQVLRIGLEEGAKFLPYVIAAVVLFRLAHFPDIGIEGTFALGVTSMVAASNYHLPIILAYVLACLMGALGGLLTGVLFIWFRLNSLICGIITTLVSFSICFALLGFQPIASLPVCTTEAKVGFSGLLMIIGLCVFFSTRFGLSFRLCGESPRLLSRMGLDPGGRYLFLMALGNALSAFSGALYVGVLGSASLNVGDGKLILAIISIIMGEGLISLILILPAKALGGAMPEALAKGSRFMSSIFSGTGAIYALIAGGLGSFAYWIIYNACVEFLGAHAFTKMVLGSVTGILLILSMYCAKRHKRLSLWTFHGEFE